MISAVSNGKPGRPPYAPSDQDRRSVHALAAYGIDQGEIAQVLGISQHTLRKHFRRELDIALAEASARIAEKLYAKALGGDVTAMIFWSSPHA